MDSTLEEYAADSVLVWLFSFSLTHAHWIVYIQGVLCGQTEIAVSPLTLAQPTSKSKTKENIFLQPSRLCWGYISISLQECCSGLIVCSRFHPEAVETFAIILLLDISVTFVQIKEELEEGCLFRDSDVLCAHLNHFLLLSWTGSLSNKNNQLL